MKPRVSLRMISIGMIAVLSVFLIASTFFVMERMLLRNIDELEESHVKKNLLIAENAILNKVSNLGSVAQDWAAWDESYMFLKNPVDSYIEDNLHIDALLNLEINLFAFVNTQGDYVFATGIDLLQQDFVPINEDFKDVLAPSGILTNTNMEYRLKGILQLEEGVLMIHSFPVITSNFQGPVVGNLLLGRFLDNSFTDGLSEGLQMQIKTSPIISTGDGKSEINNNTVKIIDKEFVMGIDQLSDIFEKPVVNLHVIIPREVRAIGERGIKGVLATSLATTLFFSIMVLLFVDRKILKRIEALSQWVLAVDPLSMSGNNSNQKLSIENFQHNNDELGILHQEISLMLSQIRDSSLKIRESEEKYRTLVENSSSVIFSLNKEGRVSYVSPNCFRTLGLQCSKLGCSSFLEIIYEEDRVNWLGFIHDFINSHNSADVMECRVKTQKEEEPEEFRWFLLRISKTVPCAPDQEEMYILVLNDIHERKVAEYALLDAQNILESKVEERTREITKIAYHDTLTGLPNRIMFMEKLAQAVSAAEKTGENFGVIFIDVDDFKVINDSLGHDQGDLLLQHIGRRLSAKLRDVDVIARFGGDEFILLLRNLDENRDIQAVSEKILNIFRDPYEIDEKTFYINISAGMSIYPIDGKDVETLIKNADMAMYKSKEDGKGMFSLCTPAMKDRIQETMTITHNLYNALENGELYLEYQPQVETITEKISVFEALLRWENPVLGQVSPARFIPIAEKTGLMVSIGDWVIRKACQQAVEWEKKTSRKIRMAVNVSLLQLKKDDFISNVREILENTGLTPSSLELEITENIAMNQDVYIMERLSLLKNLGISISIDDFGTEYSSLSRLKEMPFDRIKIAMPFIQGIGRSKKDESITEAVLQLAKSLNVAAIAEGVETHEQLDFLKKRSCEEIQGFYFHRPLSSQAAEELLEVTCQ